MKSKFLSVASLILFTISALTLKGQETRENLNQALSAKSINVNSSILYGKKLPPSGVEGDYYMFSKRMPGEMEMTSGRKFKNQRLQYDLYKNELEVLLNNSIYVIPSGNVKSLLLYDSVDRRFVNGSDYQFLEDSLTGFLEILAEGEITLLLQTVLHIKNPTYRSDSNMGNRNFVISKKYNLYITKGKVLVKLTKKNKLNYKWFSEKENVVSYLKENKLKLSNMSDAIFAVEYYNSH